MKRGRSTPTPSAANQARFAAIQEAGCIVAMMRGLGHIHPEIHHLTVGGRHGQKRRGHDYTVGLNSWSHRGTPIYGWTADECLERMGPSYALTPRLFRETFGSDEELLEYQNRAIRRSNEGE